MPRENCDLIVVGSGFGGAVCALRAAEAGLRVVVLERGRRMTPRVYQDMAEGHAPIFHQEGKPGLLELHRLKGLLALTASGVGGGSNIYTAVTVRPPSDAFDDGWPSDLNLENLSPYYDRVEAMIAPTPIPEAVSRTKALESIGQKMGMDAARLPLSMTWPEDTASLHKQPVTNGVYRELATWLQGGRVARKKTLDQTYLPQAESHGAEIRPRSEVNAIIPESGVYRVIYRRWRSTAWQESSITARRVVIAAGSLNTTRLLLKCRDVLKTLPDLSSRLGQRFYTNGDFGGLLIGPEIDLDPDAGPPVTAWLDLWKRKRMYLMETGLVPYDFGNFAGLLNPATWYKGMRLTTAKRRTWSFGVMGYDDNPGRLVLGRRGTLIHRHDPSRGAAFHQRSTSALKELAEAAGGKLLAPPAVFARRLPITVHPLGGAGMAESPESGVTNPYGEVFGYPGLFIADGSLLPKPTGAPPSMTIAALAERNIEQLVRCGDLL